LKAISDIVSFLGTLAGLLGFIGVDFNKLKGIVSDFINKISSSVGSVRAFIAELLRFSKILGGRLLSEIISISQWLGRGFVGALKQVGFAVKFLGRLIAHLASNQLIRLSAAFKSFGGFALRLAGLLGGGLLKGFFLIINVVRALSVALLTNPIVLAVTAIAASAFLIYKYWEPIKGFFLGLINSVKAFFADGFLNGINKILYAFNPAVIIGTAIQNVVKALTGVDLYAEGSKLFQSLFDGAKDMWAQFSTWIIDAISSLPAKLGGGAVDFFRKVTGFLQPAPDQFEETTNGQLTIRERIKPKSNGSSTDSLIFGGKAVGNLGQQGALPGGSAANTNVGGRLDIKIDSQGNARVAKLEKNGPMDLDVSTGRMMASA